MYCFLNHFLPPLASVAPPAALSLLPASVDPAVPPAVWPGLTYFFFLFLYIFYLIVAFLSS